MSTARSTEPPFETHGQGLVSSATILALGVIAAAGLGVADFLGACASKHVAPITAAFSVQLIGTLVFVLWYAAFHPGMPNMSVGIVAYAIAGSLLIGAGACTLYLAFEIGPVSLASPLSAAYPVVTTAVSALVFHAAVGLAQFAAVVVIVAGIMATSGLFGVKASERKIGTGPRLALLTTILWGLAYPLLGHAIDAAGWHSVTLIQFVVLVPTLGIALWLRSDTEKVTLPRIGQTLCNPFVVGAGVLQLMACLAINFGFQSGQAAGSLVVAVSATYPVVTLLFAIRHFREHMEKWAMAGAGATIAGVIALQYF